MGQDNRPQNQQKGQNSTATVPAIVTSTGTTFGGSGQPMDIGKMRVEGLCFLCKQKGHVKANCPNRKPFQVRQMLDDMSEFDRAAVLEKYGKKVIEEKPAESKGQGFQSPQQ